MPRSAPTSGPDRGPLGGTLASPASRAVVGTLVSVVGVQALLFVTGVIATRLLGPTDRGHLALIWTVSLTVGQIGSLGLPLAVTFELAAGRTTIPALTGAIGRRVAAQIAVVTGVYAVALLVLVAVSTVPVVPALASLAVVPFNLVLLFCLAALQGTRRFRAMNVSLAVPLVFYAVALVVLAVLDAVTLLSTVLAWEAGYVVGAVAGIRACRRVPDRPTAPAGPDGASGSDAAGSAAPTGSTPAEPPDLRAMRRFGLRGFLGWASPTDTLRVDQLVVGLVLPARTLGIYVAALAFTNLPRFIGQAVGLVAYPAVANAAPGAARRRAMLRWTALGAGLSVLGCGAIALLAGPLVRLAFGDEFRAAAGPLRVLLVATALLCVRRIVSDVLRGAGQEQRGSQAEAASWIVLVPGLFLLAGPFELYGVAATLVVTYAVSLAVIVVLARRPRDDGRPPAGAAVSAAPGAAPTGDPAGSTG